MATATWNVAAATSLLYGSEPPSRLAKGHAVPIEARSVVDFNSVTYAGLQDLSTPSVQQQLITYYRHQVRLIQKSAGMEVGAKEETDVKDDTAKSSVEQVRVIGILTSVSDPSELSGSGMQSPWGLHVIREIDADNDYIAAMVELKSSEEYKSALLPLTMETSSENVNEPNLLRDQQSEASEGFRVSLYLKFAKKFSGIYTGMVIGVVGECFQKSISGAMTSILVKELVNPPCPLVPWGIPSPPPSQATVETNRSDQQPPIGTVRQARVHFCCGPFPQTDMSPLLRLVIETALQRGAEVVIIGGPLVRPFNNDLERHLALLPGTFSDMIDSYIDAVEEVLNEYYSMNTSARRLKVVFVSHKDDVTQIPVLPTSIYAVPDGDDFVVRSNPCRISIGGVHIGVFNDDSISPLQAAMVERWPQTEGNLRRVVEALVQSRCYTPLFGFPSPHVDLKLWDQLRLAYLPASKPSDSAEAISSWESGARVVDPASSANDAAAAESRPSQRIKTEENQEDIDIHPQQLAATEPLPHIIFMPSIRPAFAVATHRGIVNPATGTIHPECDLDDFSKTSGPFVINQQIWSQRLSRTFEMRVAELSILDIDHVLQHGVSAEHVSCGLLHIYNA